MINEKKRNNNIFPFVILLLIKDLYGLNSSITLQIKGTGTQQIFSDTPELSYKGIEQIDKIYINNIIQNRIDYYIYNLTNQTNNITIIFKENYNEYLIDLSCMFYNCGSILSIDLTHLNTTNINSIFKIFYNCRSLLSVDLGNLNTSEFTDMGLCFNFVPLYHP